MVVEQTHKANNMMKNSDILILINSNIVFLH